MINFVVITRNRSKLIGPLISNLSLVKDSRTIIWVNNSSKDEESSYKRVFSENNRSIDQIFFSKEKGNILHQRISSLKKMKKLGIKGHIMFIDDDDKISNTFIKKIKSSKLELINIFNIKLDNKPISFKGPSKFDKNIVKKSLQPSTFLIDSHIFYKYISRKFDPLFKTISMGDDKILFTEILKMADDMRIRFKKWRFNSIIYNTKSVSITRNDYRDVKADLLANKYLLNKERSKVNSELFWLLLKHRIKDLKNNKYSNYAKRKMEIEKIKKQYRGDIV